jgi:hypothetical protein
MEPSPMVGRRFAGRLGRAGYALWVLSLVPLSVTGWVLGVGCGALILLAGWGLIVALRGRGGKDGL